MKKVIIALFVATFFVASCDKNDKKEQQQNVEKANAVEEVSEQLEIRFSFKTNKEDVFRIMMNNIKVDELQKKNIQIFETVSPTSKFEKITARFDEGNMSKNIVFNLGNKNVKEVTVKNISITYRDKVIDIKTPAQMDKLLKFNKYAQNDTTSMTVKTMKIGGKYNPAFSFSKSLLKRLNKK